MPADKNMLEAPTGSLRGARFEHVLDDKPWADWLHGWLTKSSAFVDANSNLSGTPLDDAVALYAQFLAWKYLCDQGEQNPGGMTVGPVSVQFGQSGGKSACRLAAEYARLAAAAMGVSLETIVPVTRTPTTQSIETTVST